jgi:hypothetical protein
MWDRFLKKKLTKKKNLQPFFYQFNTLSILMAKKSSKMTAADYASIKQEIDAASFKYMLKYGI